MKYLALFVIFEKVAKFLNCRLQQIIGGALRINDTYLISLRSMSASGKRISSGTSIALTVNDK